LIKNIIFDLGHVLVDVDYTNFGRKLDSDGVNEEKYRSYFTRENYRNLGYEAGRISTGEFIKKCTRDLNLKMTAKEFADAFNDVFSELKQMTDMLRKLSEDGRYNLFLLSNTSPLHFDFIRGHYDFIEHFYKLGLSYELKAIKPKPEIYSRAIDYFGILKTSDAVFIDDLEENCAGARVFGLHAIQYNDKKHFEFEKTFFNLIERR